MSTANPTPGDADREAWTRKLAAQANNRAWALAEMPKRTAAEDAEMLDAAHASRHLWAAIGTDQHHAYADLLLGQVHALLGLGSSATAYAQAAERWFAARDNEPWQSALLHGVLANAAWACGDRGSHRDHYAKARAAAERIVGAEDREIVEATLAVIPSPG